VGAGPPALLNLELDAEAAAEGGPPLPGGNAALSQSPRCAGVRDVGQRARHPPSGRALVPKALSLHRGRRPGPLMPATAALLEACLLTGPMARPGCGPRHPGLPGLWRGSDHPGKGGGTLFVATGAFLLRTPRGPGATPAARQHLAGRRRPVAGCWRCCSPPSWPLPSCSSGLKRSRRRGRFSANALAALESGCWTQAPNDASAWQQPSATCSWRFGR